MSIATESAPIGPLSYTQTMPREPESACLARRLVAAALRTWGLSQLGDTSALVVSELVGNAAAHTRSRRIRVTITRVDPLRVRVAVVDRSHKEPAVRETGPEDEGGRGMLLIESVSARWGTDLLPWGKRVWVEIGPPEYREADGAAGQGGQPQADRAGRDAGQPHPQGHPVRPPGHVRADVPQR